MLVVNFDYNACCLWKHSCEISHENFKWGAHTMLYLLLLPTFSSHGGNAGAVSSGDEENLRLSFKYLIFGAWVENVFRQCKSLKQTLRSALNHLGMLYHTFLYHLSSLIGFTPSLCIVGSLFVSAFKGQGRIGRIMQFNLFMCYYYNCRQRTVPRGLPRCLKDPVLQ